MDYAKESLRLHGEWRGKIEVTATVPSVDSKEELSLAYTPGVAQPCLEIQKDIEQELRADPPLEHCGRRHRRLRRAGAGRHRPGGGDARHGGQVRAVQGASAVWTPFPLCVQQPRTWTRSCSTVYTICRVLRRRQPGGYRRTPVL